MKHVIFRGVKLDNYFACRDGYIWSSMKGKLKKLAGASKRKYPYVTIRVDGKSYSIAVHRLVCETYNKFPIPQGIPKRDWSITPESVKQYTYSSYHVNHIDHDTKNSRPENLEWVSVRENNAKYQEYRSGLQ